MARNLCINIRDPCNPETEYLVSEPTSTSQRICECNPGLVRNDEGQCTQGDCAQWQWQFGCPGGMDPLDPFTSCSLDPITNNRECSDAICCTPKRCENHVTCAAPLTPNPDVEFCSRAGCVDYLEGSSHDCCVAPPSHVGGNPPATGGGAPPATGGGSPPATGGGSPPATGGRPPPAVCEHYDVDEAQAPGTALEWSSGTPYSFQVNEYDIETVHEGQSLMMYSSARYLSELRDVIGPICSAGKIFAVTLRSERTECALLSGDRRRCIVIPRTRRVNIRVWDISHGSSYPNYSAQMLLADGTVSWARFNSQGLAPFAEGDWIDFSPNPVSMRVGMTLAGRSDGLSTADLSRKVASMVDGVSSSSVHIRVGPSSRRRELQGATGDSFGIQVQVAMGSHAAAVNASSLVAAQSSVPGRMSLVLGVTVNEMGTPSVVSDADAPGAASSPPPPPSPPPASPPAPPSLPRHACCVPIRRTFSWWWTRYGNSCGRCPTAGHFRFQGSCRSRFQCS